MRYVLIITAIVTIFAAAGCQSRQQAYRWHYRAGTMYEYNKLMEAYDPSTGNPPPLPPLSDEPAMGTWVKVPVNEDGQAYHEYDADGRLVIVDDPYPDDWPRPRTFVGTSYFYSPRHRGSSISIGIGFGWPGPCNYGFGHHHRPFGPWGHGFHCWR
ncbi:MAG TPA: hypothetical protein P5279_15785 [Anaerohalosphaeraceae bacterium]|jgi:hypothetical protein|nr:hypothetical protein [Anaerohalosphaeraceae bacterium]HRT51950.1 hypothetical protein [Anaerohalosphaeraceae bacterium]HRT88006.1 hypothetical protein [Anaerohalosphaeraceae bacterium]